MPPRELLRENWDQAVLTKHGGIVLLASGHFASWHSSEPGTVRRLVSPAGIVQLARAASSAVALDQTDHLWLVRDHGTEAIKPLWKGCRWLYDSQQEGKALARLHTGELIVLDVDTASARVISLPVGGTSQAALASDGTLWIMAGGLWCMRKGSETWEAILKVRADQIHPFADSILLLSEGLIAANTGLRVPKLKQTQLLITSADLAAAMHFQAKITIWASFDPEGHQVVKAHPAARQMALSSSGLLLTW